jgi:hypothetical protein
MRKVLGIELVYWLLDLVQRKLVEVVALLSCIRGDTAFESQPGH